MLNVRLSVFPTQETESKQGLQDQIRTLQSQLQSKKRRVKTTTAMI